MEFFNYFFALKRAPRPKSQPVALFIAGYALFFSSFYLGGVVGWFPFLAALAFAAGLTISYMCNSTPNLETVFPVNHKKKLIYRFLSSLLMFLMLTAMVVITILVVLAISFIFASIASGGFEWLHEEEFVTDTNIMVNKVFGSMGVYGGLFGLAYFVILYSAGMVTGFIKKRKTRNIFLTCLCAGVALSWLIMCIPYIIKNSSLSLSGASPFNSACYEAMSAPWV